MIETMGKSVVKILEYGYRFNIYLYKDLDQYYRQETPGIRQIIWASFCRFQLIITILRLVLGLYFKNQMMRVILADPGFELENRSVLYLVLSGALICTFCMLVFIQYQDLNFKCPVMNLFHSISKGSLPFSLSHSDEKRLTFLTHLLTKYMIRQTYYLLMAFSSAFYLYLLIMAYFDTDSGLSLFWIFLWLCPTYLAFSQFYGNNSDLIQLFFENQIILLIQ